MKGLQSSVKKVEDPKNEEPPSPTKKQKAQQKEPQIILLISKWMQTIAVMLDKHE